MRPIPVRLLALVAALATVAPAPSTRPRRRIPSRPVRFIVPYAAGGSGDLLAHCSATACRHLGEAGRVDERAGGGGDRDQAAAHSTRRLYALSDDDGAHRRREPLQARPLRLERDFAPG